MAEGKRGLYKGSANQATMKYKGETIMVTYGKNGMISDGWVVR